MAETGKSFFIDLTRCTACRGCQIACKQWNKLPAEKTHNWGSHQNPKDLSFNTYKTVRMEEVVDKNGDMVTWLFFPEQCRHCVEPPCMLQADMEVEGTITQDKDTGAVLFTKDTAKVTFKDVYEACPYRIPRQDPKTKVMSKCTMCNDRVKAGLKPACVQTCPTGTMNFGDRDEMLALAQKQLEIVKKTKPNAQLIDAGSTRVIYLVEDDPKKYYQYLMAEAEIPTQTPGTITRRAALGKAFDPLRRIFG